MALHYEPFRVNPALHMVHEVGEVQAAQFAVQMA